MTKMLPVSWNRHLGHHKHSRRMICQYSLRRRFGRFALLANDSNYSVWTNCSMLKNCAGWRTPRSVLHVLSGWAVLQTCKWLWASVRQETCDTELDLDLRRPLCHSAKCQWCVSSPSLQPNKGILSLAFTSKRKWGPAMWLPTGNCNGRCVCVQCSGCLQGPREGQCQDWEALNKTFRSSWSRASEAHGWACQLWHAPPGSDDNIITAHAT